MRTGFAASLVVTIALAVALPATGADITDAVVVWERTKSGEVGRAGALDTARAVAIGADHEVVAAGWVEGGTMVSGPETYYEQSNALAVKYDVAGEQVWTVFHDDGFIDYPFGARQSSEDRFTSLAIDDAGDVVLAGSQSGAGTNPEPYHQSWWVRKVAGDDGTQIWEDQYIIESGSAWQGVDGLVLGAGGSVWATGSAFGNWGPIQHEWLTRAYESDGDVLLAGVTYNFASIYQLPDQAFGLALWDDAFAAVGERGVTYTSDTDKDLDWVVRKHDLSGALQWMAVRAGPSQSLDYASEAVVDAAGNLIVVGYTNAGEDHTAANIDWDSVIVKYTEDGDGQGGPVVLWDVEIPGAEGRSLTLYDLDLHPNGVDVYAAGAEQISDTLSVPILLQIDGADGSVIAKRTWDVSISSSWVSVDARDGFVALAGHLPGATDLDFTVMLLEDDTDADGVRDSLDGCPDDPAKDAPGACGCGVPDTDGDADGVVDCHDLCLGTPPDVTVDATGCPDEVDTGDTGDTGDDTGDTDTGGDDTDDEPEDDTGECGCATAAPGGWIGLLALALARRRRR